MRQEQASLSPHHTPDAPVMPPQTPALPENPRTNRASARVVYLRPQDAPAPPVQQAADADRDRSTPAPVCCNHNCNEGRTCPYALSPGRTLSDVLADAMRSGCRFIAGAARR